MLSNLVLRTITGIVFVAVLIAAILLGLWWFGGLFLLISLGSIWEFYSLIEKGGAKPQKILGSLIGVFLFMGFFLSGSGQISAEILWVLVPFSISVFIVELYRKQEQAFSNIALTLLGVGYVVLPFALFSGMVFRSPTVSEYYPYILLGYFILIWLYDSGAYIFGVSFGKHRLFERISPKKSWEGLIGGAIVALLAAWLLSHYFIGIGLLDWIVIAVIVVVAGTYGDLAESMLKRQMGVKDSGNILPGHGGILDRFDAVFLSSPLVYVYLQLVYA